MALEPNALLNHRYRIHSELGRGGMGAVYRGHDDNLGVEVAIKENLVTNPDAEKQFRREATLLASLRHPHLPRVTDHFVIPHQGQYLVMDFIPGEDAKQRLEAHAGPLPLQDVLKWGRQILDALQYLHTRPQPVIHRDIKPGNIKITPDGRAVLVDFGLAKLQDIGQRTSTGAHALTPGFAPPEQYGMGGTDARTDLYSLAATLYVLLTNTMPADSLERAMGNITLQPVREINPAVPIPMAEAIECALAIKPEDRFTSATEFSAALIAPPAAATMARPTMAVEDKAATRPVAGGGSNWRWALFPAGVVIVLLIGTLGFFVFNQPATTPSATLTNVPDVASLTPLPVETATLAPTSLVVRASATPMPVEPSASAPPTDLPILAATFTPAATAVGSGLGQIAFVSERTGQPQIFVAQVNDPANMRQLTNRSDGACQPAWSPDGAFILFVAPCTGKDNRQQSRAAIYRIPAAGGEAQQFILGFGGQFEPDWSAAGILYTSLEDSSGSRIYVYTDTTRSGKGKLISQGQSDDSQPSWSPSGRLAFRNTSRGGLPTIFWMNQDGSFDTGRTRPEQITRDVDARNPAWSPGAGEFVAYNVSGQIWVIQWDKRGFEARAVTNGASDAPTWSPDGQWLAFEGWAQDVANHDIYLMPAFTGVEQTRLTNDPALEYQAAWGP